MDVKRMMFVITDLYIILNDIVHIGLQDKGESQTDCA